MKIKNIGDLMIFWLAYFFIYLSFVMEFHLRYSGYGEGVMHSTNFYLLCFLTFLFTIIFLKLYLRLFLSQKLLFVISGIVTCELLAYIYMYVFVEELKIITYLGIYVYLTLSLLGLMFVLVALVKTRNIKMNVNYSSYSTHFMFFLFILFFTDFVLYENITEYIYGHYNGMSVFVDFSFYIRSAIIPSYPSGSKALYLLPWFAWGVFFLLLFAFVISFLMKKKERFVKKRIL